MKQQPMIMNPANMVDASYFSSSRVTNAMEFARKLVDDPDRAERTAKQSCKACYYFTQIGGAAITTRPCMCCGKDQIYGSTNTDALCLDCAKNHDLCKKCGGDIKMNSRRRNWPKPERKALQGGEGNGE